MNPASGVSIKRESSGALRRPEFDGGMPRINAAFLQVFYDAISLSASTAGEYINFDYGLDGADPTTALGNFLSGDKDLDLGTSSRGVSAKTFTAQETYNRDAGVNTDSPQGRSLELVYLKKPTRLQSFEFEIDMVATARNRMGGVEQVIADLETAIDSVTLLPFKYGKMAQVNVRVRTPESMEQWTEVPNAFDEGERRGTVRVVVEEVL
mgnify:FL=1